MTRLVLLALALAACGTDPSHGGEPTPSQDLTPSSPAFFGTEWRPVAVAGARLDSLPGADALVSVAFTDGPFGDLDPEAFSLGGYSGCNDFGMAYRLDGDPASADGAAFRPGMVVSDAQACGAPGEHVSDYVLAGIGEARRVRLDGGRLTLLDSLGVERIAFEPRPVRTVDPTAVVTGAWQLDASASTVTGDGGGALHPLTVAFRPDSTFSGALACARFSGTYAIRGDRFRTTSSDAFDTGACGAGAPAWMGETVLAVGEIEASARRLVLHRRRDGRRAVFVRHAPVKPQTPASDPDR